MVFEGGSAGMSSGAINKTVSFGLATAMIFRPM